METDRERFKGLADELKRLRECEPNESAFFEKHHGKVKALLEFSQFESDKSCKHYYENTYKCFRKQYVHYWMKRLLPYRLGKCTQKRAEDLEAGKESLQNFLSILDEIPSLSSVLGGTTLCFVRSNYYGLQALVLMKRKGDTHQILQSWQNAGEVCFKSAGTKRRLPQDLELLAQGHVCLSQAHKLEAFSLLRKPPGDFRQVIGRMQLSREEAQKAVGLYGRTGKDILKKRTLKHVIYLDYWLNVFQSRQSILDKRFSESKDAIEKAKVCAQQLDPRGREIFPNRFFNMQDLENEWHFIDACEALQRHDLAGCKSSLEKWLSESRSIKGTWRYINVDLRRRANDCLIHRFIDMNEEAYRQSIDELQKRVASRPQVGEHTRHIIKVLRLPLDYLEGVCGELYGVFPLDSCPRSRYENKLLLLPEEEKLRQLPGFYSDWLYPPALRSKDGQAAFLTVDYVFLHYVRTVTEHCYHYFKLWTNYGRISRPLPDDFPTRFDALTWDELQRAIQDLSCVLENSSKATDLSKLFAFIGSYQKRNCSIKTQLFQKSEASCLSSQLTIGLADEVRRILVDTGRHLFPHPVKVKLIETQRDSSRTVYTLERLWDKDEKEFYLVVDTHHDYLEKGRFYFLGSKWKSKDYDLVEFEVRKDENENFLKEIIPSVSFGVPGAHCVLLCEGDTEEIALSLLLDHMNCYWRLLKIELVNCGGKGDVPKPHRHHREQDKCVVTILDADAKESNRRTSTLRSIVRDESNTFILYPDFEGTNFQYFATCVNRLYPDLNVDAARLQTVAYRRIERLGWDGWEGTVDGAFMGEYLREIVTEERRPQYKIEKKSLAPTLAQEMIDNGIPEKLEQALRRLLDLAEGRSEYT